MELKAGLKYTKTHEWIKIEGSSAKIGVTDYAQQQLTDIVYIEIPAEGSKVVKGSTFGVIESVKAVEDVYSPLTGTVKAKNESLINSPELLNNDPYEAWLIEVIIEKTEELNELMDEKQYESFLNTLKH